MAKRLSTAHGKQLIHVVDQKLTQQCKAVLLQLKKKTNHLKQRYRNAESLKMKKTRKILKGAPGAV